MFSGVGAVIGSVIGANPKRKIKRISIDITYEVDGQCQLFNACLYNGKPIKASGIEYESYVNSAKKVMGQLDMLIKGKGKKISEVAMISSADEIRKYKALMDDGIITEEEFLTKKKQLLGGDVCVDENKDGQIPNAKLSVESERTAEHEAEQAVKEDLREYLVNNFYPEDKVGAVKYYRESTGEGIIEAKKYIDDLFDNA